MITNSDGEVLESVKGHEVHAWTKVVVGGVERECPVIKVDGVPLVLHPDQLSHTVDGLEVPDQQEMDIPLGFEKPVPLHVQMAQMIRTELSALAERHGMETEEEANDFSIDDGEVGFSEAELADMAADVVPDVAPKPAADVEVPQPPAPPAPAKPAA